MTTTYHTATMKFALTGAIFVSLAGNAFAHDLSRQFARFNDFTAHYSPASESYHTLPEFQRDLNGTPCGVDCGASLQTPSFTRAEPAGTRGRLGLGANPASPEGPGNVSN